MSHSTFRHGALVGLLATAMLAGCAGTPGNRSTDATYQGPPLQEQVVAVTARHELITFKAAEPGTVTARRPVTGLAAGERLVGIDFRVSRGVLFALADNGRLYTLDVATAAARPVGAAPAALPLQGPVFGFDFNPVADLIRVVSSGGQNLRLHPETGAVVDGDPNQPGVQTDPALRFAPDDTNAGRAPDIVAAAYTYNTQNPKITTNYAIDRTLGALVMQGSPEGVQPVVSPNTGLLRTVGVLGLGRLSDAAFDISDVKNTALAAVRTPGDTRSRLVHIDLASGRASVVGVIGTGEVLVGMGIEP